LKINVLALEKQGKLDLEFWKDIALWEGVYQISSHGRLKSFKVDKGGRILSHVNSKGDYLSVVLCQQGRKRYSTRMHRLVANAFIPNPNNYPQVNHKNLNKQDNSVDNLEWVTPEENRLDAIKKGVDFHKGMNNYNKYVRPRQIYQFTLKREFIREYPNSIEAAIITKVCSRNILQVANKEQYRPGKTRKQAGGFIWAFHKEPEDV